MLGNISKLYENKIAVGQNAFTANATVAGSDISYAGEYLGISATLFVSAFTTGKAKLKLEVTDSAGVLAEVTSFVSPELTAIGSVNVNLSDYDEVQAGWKIRLSIIGSDTAVLTASAILTGSVKKIDAS
tara:strand:- start:14807 stop:15193 length:387 start_codon:yes stop_codon:yes gene_type:complete